MSDQPGTPGPWNFPQRQAPQPSGFGPPQTPVPGPTGPPAMGTSPYGMNTAFTPVPTPPPAGGSGGRTALILVSVLAILGLSTAAFLILRDDGSSEIKTASTQFQIDELPQTTLPDVLSTLPTIPPVTIGGDPVPTTIAPTGEPSATTLPEVATTLPQPPATVNLFDGTKTADVVAAIAAARGASPLRILDLNLYNEFAVADVQDPTTPANIDEFNWRAGAVAAPNPVQLTGDGDLESNLFSDTEVNWNAIPGLVGAALAQIPIEGGSVTHVHVYRNLPFDDGIKIRVFVDGTRTNGFLDADGQGNITEVNQG